MGTVVKLARTTGGRSPEDEAVLRIGAWLRRAAAQRDISFEQWGRKAGIAPTTITRFLRDGRPVPKATTLAALANAIGEHPPELGTMTRTGMVEVPVIIARMAILKGMAVAMASSVEATRTAARFAHCAAVRISADTAALAGVLVGDLVVFDPAAVPQPGSLVVVELSDGGVGCFRFQPPWLLPATTGHAVPLPVDGAAMLGVAVQVQRDLA